MEDPDDWRDNAACKGMSVHDFYPEDRHEINSQGFRAEVEELRAICAQCPVSAECLSYALQSPLTMDSGIFAGTTRAQRKTLKKTIDSEQEGD